MRPTQVGHLSLIEKRQPSAAVRGDTMLWLQYRMRRVVEQLQNIGLGNASNIDSVRSARRQGATRRPRNAIAFALACVAPVALTGSAAAQSAQDVHVFGTAHL